MNNLIRKPDGDPQVTGERRLTAAQSRHLAEVPAAVEWFANIGNLSTRLAYQNDLNDFCSYIGIAGTEEFRAVNQPSRN